MSTTVLEALQNSQINFHNFERTMHTPHPFFVIAKGQLDNAIKALENVENE